VRRTIAKTGQWQGEMWNRRMFHDKLRAERRKTDRSLTPMALVLIDLDRFKEVSDTLGHAQGDVLLEEAAQRLQASVRASDTVAQHVQCA
jgi:diguanylate cyclase (GGDEF)-like protein